MLVLVVVLGSVLVFALFLVLMIPLAAIIINQIAFPLQLIASQFGEAITLAFAMMLLLRRILLQAAAHDSRNASRTSSRHHGRGPERHRCFAAAGFVGLALQVGPAHRSRLGRGDGEIKLHKPIIVNGFGHGL